MLGRAVGSRLMLLWRPASVLVGSTPSSAAEMITIEARTWSGSTAAPEAWAAQLADLERTPRSDDQRWSEPGALRIGAGLMGMLLHLPVLPCLLPPPSRWGRLRRSSPRTASTVDGRVLDKVRALLAKAESTEFEEEADALTAKAQELMARHAIDQAMVAAVTSSEEPGGRRIGVGDPYAQSKAQPVSRHRQCQPMPQCVDGGLWVLDGFRLCGRRRHASRFSTSRCWSRRHGR